VFTNRALFLFCSSRNPYCKTSCHETSAHSIPLLRSPLLHRIVQLQLVTFGTWEDSVVRMPEPWLTTPVERPHASKLGIVVWVPPMLRPQLYPLCSLDGSCIMGGGSAPGRHPRPTSTHQCTTPRQARDTVEECAPISIPHPLSEIPLLDNATPDTAFAFGSRRAGTVRACRTYRTLPVRRMKIQAGSSVSVIVALRSIYY
jgi:hypothetical protein